DGESCWKDMLIELEKAEKYIFLEYFIIEPGEMWDSIVEILKRKAAQGVDVRVMYDGVGSLTQMPKKYPRELRSYGISCKAYNPLLPFLSTLQNNRDHRKIMAIDGKVAFNGGINLADEYINKKQLFGHWKDTAVRVKGDAAYSFTVMFLQLWQVWQNFDKVEINPEDFRPENVPVVKNDGYVMPYADIPNDNYQVGEFVYMEIINKAKDYVHITTPYLILDNEMMTALVNAARSGIDVKIIIPGKADHWYAYYVALDYAKELISNGVEVYEYTPGFIHAKNFVSDDEVAVVGSINLDYRSLYLHFECATWMYNSTAVKDISDDFNETLKKCRLLTVKDLDSRPIWKRIISAILRIFAPLM
ncbi:MAG: cardiolipin synthase, partial [Clostridia bacterium]